jgi:calcineurin-like phosphoesterase family protein
MAWRDRPSLVGLLIAAIAAGAAAACRDASRSNRAPSVREGTPDAVRPGALTLPNRATSVKFAVIGDSGRGTPPQYEIAAQMRAYHERFAYPFVLMVGDNIYEGAATEEDYRKKFEEPYRPLLDAGIKFYAVLGNHDDPLQIAYRPFNMNGARYYSFTPPEDVLTKLATRVEFFALDSTYLDRDQMRWADERLAASRAAWKICFFHHPLYTSGRYRLSSRAYRIRLEPLLLRHGVDAVFSGHEHIYQRSRLLGGIQYFVSGGAGSLRPDDGRPASYVARTFASDYHFMLVEIDGRELHFQAIARSGQTIDAGTLYKDEGDAREDDQAVATPRDMPARR